MRDASERRALQTESAPISLTYGNRQTFRLRTPDINILGRITLPRPIVTAQYSLNDGPPAAFHVEPDPPSATEPSQHETASRLRLNAPGQFNIEIPTADPWLAEGANTVRIEVENASGHQEAETVHFSWDPEPVPLPLELGDLSGFATVQDLGQVVDGGFEIDRKANTIRTTSPVAWDALLVLGSPNRSQEATYDVTFGDWQSDTVFGGASDFFASHDEQAPELAIKPGYTSAGLVTIRPNGVGETWIMCGQLLKDHSWSWRRISRFPAAVDPGATYSVRHRVIIEESVNWVQFKIWPKGESEPVSWMADSDNALMRGRCKPVEQGSFGLFQFGGQPTSWSNIRVQALEIDDSIEQAIRQKKRPVNVAVARIGDFASRVGRRLARLGRQMAPGSK